MSGAVVLDIDVHLANGMLLSVPEHLPGRDPLISDTLNHLDYTTITRLLVATNWCVSGAGSLAA